MKKIAELYGIDVLDFSPISGGNSNSNYHLYTESDEYILTIAEEAILSQVKKLATLLQWLNQHNFFTSQVQPILSGELVTQPPHLIIQQVISQINNNNNNRKIYGANATEWAELGNATTKRDGTTSFPDAQYYTQ